MFRLTHLVLALTLVVAPMTSMIATAMGFSGEHIHYDHAWHGAAEMASAKAAAHSADHHADADHHTDSDHDTQSSHDDARDDAPVKHSHVDQVHAIAFVIVNVPQLSLPDMDVATASAPASFPLQQHPYPPFRPPQVG